MTRSLDRAIAYLDRHLNRELTPATVGDDQLASMRALMRALGDPQLDVPVIQITGTNGKGSVSAMLSALLSAMGLTVGSYTSPHLTSPTERLRRNGEPIPDDEFAELVEILEATEPMLAEPPSWFELVTAAAYRWFADSAVDVAVVEVGMLGRHDATSVTEPKVAVVTNVSYDHTEGGEGWRRRLAAEKAGIIGPSSVLCLGEVDEEVEDIFVAAGPSLIHRRHDDFDCLENRLAVGGRLVTLRSPTGLYEDAFVALHGAHQGDNAAIALAAAEAFLGSTLPDDVVHEAFGAVSVPGRLEVLGLEPLVIVDGAHNPAGAEAAREAVDESFSVAGRRILVVGLMGEKDAGWMLDALGAADADLVICTQADSPRAMPAGQLGATADDEGYDVEIASSAADALERALALATEDDLVLGCGSLHLVGELRDAYQRLLPPA